MRELADSQRDYRSAYKAGANAGEVNYFHDIMQDKVPYAYGDGQRINPYPREPEQTYNKANQERMSRFAGGPVKRQNKQMKNAVVNSHVTEPAFDDPYPDPRDLVRQGRVQNKSNLTNDTAAYSDYGAKTRVNRLATPLRALPMVAPEALGMIGAAQEAQQRGVNPMVNWLQRMTPVPVVAPTGNGGEVYNYQSGERYTPMY